MAESGLPVPDRGKVPYNRCMEAPKDTDRAAYETQIAVLRRLGPEGRLAQTLELSRLSRELMEEGVRLRHPDWTADQVRREAIRLVLGAELFAAVYGRPQDDDG